MMKIKEKLNKQFQKPTGKLGRIVGLAMAIKNKDRANWTFKKLNFKPTDTILEVGYGSGIVIKKIANKLTSGKIYGVDFSEIMFSQASKRNKKHIENKKVKLELGTIWEPSFSDSSFEIIFGSNVHFFWDNPNKELGKLKSLLKPKGRLIFVFQPRWAKNETEIKEIAEKNKIEFEEIGLKNIEIEYKKMKPVTCIYISGQK